MGGDEKIPRSWVSEELDKRIGGPFRGQITTALTTGSRSVDAFAVAPPWSLANCLMGSVGADYAARLIS